MSDLLFAGLPAEIFVAELYRNFLNREPDPGAQHKVNSLESGRASAEDIVAEIIASDEYRTRVQPKARLLNDQTQFGELELLMARWISRASGNPTVVDVGARGKDRSNSWDLLTSFGWKGILFEANPNLIAPITAEFAGLDIDLIQCAVSDYDGEAVFYLGVNDDVSSLNEQASLGWGPVAGEVRVPVRRLGPMLAERGVPIDFGLLSIDIEGEDIQVLNDLIAVSGYRPRWVIIEASLNFATRSLDDLPVDPLVRALYDLVAQTAANLILELRTLPADTGAQAHPSPSSEASPSPD